MLTGQRLLGFIAIAGLLAGCGGAAPASVPPSAAPASAAAKPASAAPASTSAKPAASAYGRGRRGKPAGLFRRWFR